MQARSNPPLFRLFLALALAACGSETQPGDGGGGGGGKTDDLGEGCTFAQPSPFGDTSEDLAEHAVGNLRVTADNVDSLSELEAAQLVAAVVHLGMAEPGIEPAAALALADGGEVDLVDIEMEGDDFMAADWVSFFAGDNETGVVFADGTTQVIAEISDGDIMHCE
jgi:hypothetical protein